MPFSAHRLATFLAFLLTGASAACAQTAIANPQALASAKSIYFEDKSGVDVVGNKALAELRKWGQFQIVRDQKTADLLVVLETDPGAGGDLILSGQSGTIDGQGRVAEDPVPNYNKATPVRTAVLTVIDARTGKTLWTASQRWGGLLTGFNGVGEHLIEEFEKQTRAAAQSSSLKLLRSASPNYPPAVMQKHIEGTVAVRIVVDKSGMVTNAKAVSGPPELFRASEEAAKGYQFAPPASSPVTAELEMTYGLGPKPCPPGKRNYQGDVFYPEHLPMKTDRAGQLKIVSEIYDPLPPDPEEARAARKEGDLNLFITVASDGEVVGARVTRSVDPRIDEAALATIRTWKFRVTRGEQAGFPIQILYRLSCDSTATN
jgi:TonB family protein